MNVRLRSTEKKTAEDDARGSLSPGVFNTRFCTIWRVKWTGMVRRYKASGCYFGCGMFPLICAVSKVRHGGLFFMVVKTTAFRRLNPRVYLYLHSCSGVILFFGCGMFSLICAVGRVRHGDLFYGG